MTNDEIKQAVEKFFQTAIEKDSNYIDHVTDSWIDDAEEWFVITYKNSNISFDDVCEFRRQALKRFDEIYDEKYGERDAKYCLHRIGNDVKTLLEKYNSVKHQFKKFNAYTNAVSYQFEELVKYLQLLEDIENGKV